MASTYIEVSGTASRHSAELRGFIDRLQSIRDEAAHLKGIYDQMAAGGDYTSLGAQLGLNAADAQSVYNLFGSVNTTLSTDTFIAQLLSRVG